MEGALRVAASRKRIAILGSTGSIGRSAIEVARAHPDRFEIVGLSAFRNVDLLASQARETGARRVVVGEGRADAGTFPAGVAVESGVGALEDLASDPEVDLVVNAIVGAAGLRPTVASVSAGKRLALANKESLVAAGEIVTALARERGAEIVPVDSEHSSLSRCLRRVSPDAVAGLVLTASGGPLRDLPPEAAADAGVERVLDHPTWDMGEKVTVDSATLVNKAMEVIEARWLFGLPFDRIEVVVHRESIVHSLVRLTDGTLLAHLGAPDMRVPIQYAMFYPDAPDRAFELFDLASVGALNFAEVDRTRYPCFDLVLEAGRHGGTAPAVAATADEVAVDAFVGGRIRFGDIALIIASALDAVPRAEAVTIGDVLAAEERARAEANAAVARIEGSSAGSD
jgi:1-deoxy-D-xylulose-5-phosphate reductoisomerase